MNKLFVLNVAIIILLFAVGIAIAVSLTQLLISFLPATKSFSLVSLNPQDSVVSISVIAILFSIICYFPIGIISVYYWLEPALYEREISFFKKTIIASVLLFILGTLFGIASYISFAVPFFVWTSKLVGLQNYWSIYDIVVQSLSSGLVTGMMFLFPVVLNNLIEFNVINVNDLRKKRLLFAFCLAAIIIICPFLPNNPLEQLVVFAPIYLMYEATIFINRKSMPVMVGAIA